MKTKMKWLIRSLVALWLAPGFLFDVCIGISFILSDGKNQPGIGREFGEWLFGLYNSLPNFAHYIFYPTLFICAIPAGAVCIGALLVSIIGAVYVMMCTGKAILWLPFTGKWEWNID